MARIRTVKPQFWSSEDIGELSEPAKLLAIALLNYADDHGYFKLAYRVVENFAFAFVEPSSNIRRLFVELSSIGYLQIRESSSNRRLALITNFSAHQKVDRAQKSLIKADFDQAVPLSTAELAEEIANSTNHRRLIDERSSTEKEKEKEKEKEGEKEELLEIDNLRSTITQPSNFENSNVLEVVPGDGKGKGKANPPLLNTQKGGSQHLRPASGHAPPPNEAQMFEKILWVLWNLAQRTGQGVTDSDVRRYLAEHNPLRRLIEELGPAPTLALRLFSDQQMGTVKSWGYLWENRFSIGAKIAGSNQPDPNGWDAAMEILERRGLRSDDSESVWGEEAL